MTHPAVLLAVTGLDATLGTVWLCVVRHVPLGKSAPCSRGENAWDKILGSPRDVCLEQLTFGFALQAQKGHSVEEQKAVV